MLSLIIRSCSSLKRFTNYQAVFILSILLSRASSGWARMHTAAALTNTVDVMNFAAAGDGKTEDTRAFLKAWSKACTSPIPSILKVPRQKSFLLNRVLFQGPCKASSINVQILGNILAPKDVSAWKKGSSKSQWIVFDSIKNLKINGSGKIDGRGSTWWKCRRSHKCSDAPNALVIDGCKNFQMNGLTLANSPMMHMTVNNCTGVTISGITISAPKYSPNTDGIHLGNCKDVKISNSAIGTGDDCISIGTKTSNVNITGISCGPGHGISVGSLGYKEPAAVENILVSHCKLSDTMNGVRIKTWPGGSGYARHIRFEHITINSTQNPIIIDQYYCNGDDRNCPNKASAVKISDVTFLDVNGTSTRDTAINLACSRETVACTDIHLEHVHLRGTVSVEKVSSSCSNIKGLTSNDVIPPVTSCSTKKKKSSRGCRL